MKSAFDLLSFGAFGAKNSVVRAATAESLAAFDGRPTPELVDKYRELFEGGVGTVITGYAYVLPDGKPSEGALGIYDDAFASEYRDLVELAHKHDVRIVLQLVYGGSKSKLGSDDQRRIPAPSASANAEHAADGSGLAIDTSSSDGGCSKEQQASPNVRILGASPIANPKTGLVPVQATHKDLAGVVQAFAQAAKRACDYGFDAVEIHVAHGYLLSQFLDRRFNDRTDDYGGPLENRARLAIECVQATRKATGPEFPLFVKLNSCDAKDDPSGTRGGLGETESAQVAAWLVEAGASCIDISGDWHAYAATTGEAEPFFAPFGAKLAHQLTVPVIVTGGWRSLDVIEEHLANDGIAAIAMSRPLICEPDLVNRWLSGDTAPSKCIGCGSCAKSPGIPCALKK